MQEKVENEIFYTFLHTTVGPAFFHVNLAPSFPVSILFLNRGEEWTPLWAPNEGARLIFQFYLLKVA